MILTVIVGLIVIKLNVSVLICIFSKFIVVTRKVIQIYTIPGLIGFFFSTKSQKF